MNDLVSVIMPSYNTAKYISASIRSVMAQTYSNWELILIDDCSADETDAVVQPYLCDPRVRYFKNESNAGAALTRNRALREAKGRWVAFLDSDDLWLPEKLERQLTFMEQNGYAFSYTKYSEIDPDGAPLGVSVSGPRKITKAGMYNYCWPGCLTVMYDASAVGLIQIADIQKNNDYALWLKVCEKAACYLLDDNLALYRRGRAGSVSTHSRLTMIQWHYRMFRTAQEQSFLFAAINTGRNLLFGIAKKQFYRKRVN